jgi:hypothetical protein
MDKFAERGLRSLAVARQVFTCNLDDLIANIVFHLLILVKKHVFLFLFL